MAQPVPGSPTGSNHTICPPSPYSEHGSEKTLLPEEFLNLY